MCDSPWTGCAWWTASVWREQAEIKLARRGIFIVAWCHSVRVCALAALPFQSRFIQLLNKQRSPFQSQQSGALTRMWRWCRVQTSQKDRAIGAVCWKNEGCCCNLSVGVALKVWVSHAQYMKITRDENLPGFKPYDIWIYWLIWKLSHLFKQNWFGIDDFLLNFFATFGSVLGLQVNTGL